MYTTVPKRLFGHFTLRGAYRILGMTTHHKFATIGAVATLSLSLVGATAVPAAFAAPAANTAAVAPAANASHTYDDGATITFPSSWTVGQGLSFTGTGFKAKDGSPSVLALKIDGGGVSGQPYLRVEADANGNVAGTIPWQEGFKPAATVTIQAAAAPSASPTDTAAASAAPAPTEAAPSPSAPATQSTTEAPAASSASAAVTGKPQPPVQPSAAPSQSEQAANNSAQDSSSAEHNVPNASANAEHLAAAAQGSAVAGEIPKNCTEASARGLSNIDANSPHYGEHLDRDKDGVGCETKAPGTSGSGTASTTGGEQAAAADTSTNDELDNCTEARARGLNNIKAGSEHYSGHLDRDKDGVACESRVSGSYSGGSASRVSSSGTVASTGSTGSYSTASTARGRLASTGASGALTIAGVGLFTLVAGTAVVLVARRRKQA